MTSFGSIHIDWKNSVSKMDKEKRYAEVDDLWLDIDAYIRIIRSKYRELDPNDVLYNPKMTKSKDYLDGMIDAFYLTQARILVNGLRLSDEKIYKC